MNNRFWPEKDVSPKALAVTVREASVSCKISRNQLIRKVRDVKKAELDYSLELLSKLGILEQTDEGQYQAASSGVTCRDFLAVNLQKTARVSRNGNRSVSVKSVLMALREGITERKCGSFVWRESMPAPKHRLLPTKCWDPLDRHEKGSSTFEIEKRMKNDMVFKLKFSPSLLPGQLVHYGFYIWNENHYSRTRNEALTRYRDEWVREGLAVLDPALQLKITVELPQRYDYQKAIVEKDPVLTMDGPNQPGAEISKLELDKTKLDFSMRRPTTGHYFVSWVPPE